MVGLQSRIFKIADLCVVQQFCRPVRFQVPGSEVMASVPQGMHAAWKVRQNMTLVEKSAQRDETWNTGGGSRNWQQFPNSDKQLTQYSEKMMNSIWGLYNRYSVHNFKSNTTGGQTCYQQSA